VALPRSRRVLSSGHLRSRKVRL